jgi:hypothetical protein
LVPVIYKNKIKNELFSSRDASKEEVVLITGWHPTFNWKIYDETKVEALILKAQPILEEETISLGLRDHAKQ